MRNDHKLILRDCLAAAHPQEEDGSQQSGACLQLDHHQSIAVCSESLRRERSYPILYTNTATAKSQFLTEFIGLELRN